MRQRGSTTSRRDESSPPPSVPTTLGGGLLSSRLDAVDPRWRIWLPALACALLFPALCLFLYSPGLLLAMTGKAIYSLAFAMYIPTSITLLLDVIPSEIRAVGISIYMLVMNVVGQVVGPALIGIMSDRFTASYGEAAIRYSMSAAALFALVSTLALVIASIWVMSDSRRAAESMPQ